MKILFSFLGCICVPVLLMAQPTNSKNEYASKDIEEVEIGWKNVINYNTPVKAYSKDGWHYTVQQNEFTKTIVQWWQQSYTPVGLLGEMKQTLLAPDPGLPVSNSSYNGNEGEKDNKKALPNTYGAYSNMHKCIVKTSTKKFWPMYGNLCDIPWQIMANNIEDISKQLVGLSSPDEYYCIQVRYALGDKGSYDKDWMPSYVNYRNFTNSPNLAKYDHYYNPQFNKYTIIMTKDGKPLPFTHITVGELIGRIENRFPMMVKMASAFGNKYPANNMERTKQGLEILKRKMKEKYNEPAYTYPNFNFDFTWLSNIDEKTDISVSIKTKDKSGKIPDDYFPILRLNKGVKEACANAGPQWIVFTLALPIDLGYGGNTHLMDNFVNRFNYDYVYQYYFGSQKPTVPYKAVGYATSNDKKNELPAATASEETTKKATDKSVLFFEDFSTTAVGATPSTWTTQRSQSTGYKVEVVEVKGAKGKWMKLKRTATPKNISLPLTGDYTISFDLPVQKGDVPWGASGIEMTLDKGSTKTETSSNYNYFIKVTPGDMNRSDGAGWVSIGYNMPESFGACKRDSYYSISQFTGSKNINKVNMSVVKKGEGISVFCNSAKVYSCEKAAPADISFKNFSFHVVEGSVYHISNILIKR